MPNVTQLLDAIQAGDPHAAGELLPLVYDELRKLAARKLAGEPSGQTLQPTALVHEAYMRLVAPSRDRQGAEFANRAHFFAAAAEAMRRILIDAARRKRQVKRGGDRVRVELTEGVAATAGPDDELLALDDALTQLADADPVKAQLVELRYFAGLSEAEAAAVLGVSRATASRYWTFARAWLRDAIGGRENP